MKNKIKELRKKRGLSQRQVAEEIGLSRQYFLRVEKGDSIPTINVAKKIADYFGCSIDDIFFTHIVVQGLQKETITTS